MKQTLIFYLTLFIVTFTHAQDRIYVSPTGMANALGTKTSPLASVNQAIAMSKQVAGHDTLFIELLPGTYYLTEPIAIKNDIARPLVIEGSFEDRAIVSGGIHIGNWEQMPNGWWKANMPAVAYNGLYFEQLFMNGIRATRARTPNDSWSFVESSVQQVHHKGGGRIPEYATQSIRVKSDDIQSLATFEQSSLSDISATFFHKWDVTRKRLDFANVDSGLLNISGSAMHSWNPLTKGTRYFLENYKEALDAPGEWFLSRNGELFYIPRPGESIQDAYCVAPILKQLVEVKGSPANKVKDVFFRNISFMHSASYTPVSGNEPMQAAALVDAAIQLDFVDNIHFLNCEIKQTGNYGIWFRRDCQTSSIQRSYLHDLGAGGIKIGEFDFREPTESVTSHITVDNNIIQHAGTVFPTGVGVAVFFAANNTITHNEISDLRYTGISLGWMWGYNDASPTITTYFDQHGRLAFKSGKFKNTTVGNKVAYNHIHHIGWGELSDMGAVYTLGESYNTHIHDNVIHDVYSYDYGGWGLYTDEGSSGIVIENNLVYGCKSGGFHQHYGKDNIVRNNIFAFGQYQQLEFTKVEPHTSFEFSRNIVLMDCGKLLSGAWDKANIKMDNNCYWNLQGDTKILNQLSFAEWQKMKDQHSIFADPMFKDPVHLDFTFKNSKSIRKIGFQPFDYTKAGVYGDSKWIEKAKLSPTVIASFRTIIRNREALHSAIYQ